MTQPEPTTELDARFSSDDAVPARWSDAADRLQEASIYWLTTVRADGRPHVTPLIAVWLDHALYISTGPTEQKAKNLATNTNCVLTTGNNAMDEGLDVVLEGAAVRVRDRSELVRVADAYEAKYGSTWRFEVGDEAFVNGEHGEVLVFAVAPTKVFGFGKGEPFSQTRWRFSPGS
jgi:Pyridoxamine 5'-phosphate oxidase